MPARTKGGLVRGIPAERLVLPRFRSCARYGGAPSGLLVSPVSAPCGGSFCLCVLSGLDVSPPGWWLPPGDAPCSGRGRKPGPGWCEGEGFLFFSKENRVEVRFSGVLFLILFILLGGHTRTGTFSFSFHRKTSLEELIVAVVHPGQVPR